MRSRRRIRRPPSRSRWRVVAVLAAGCGGGGKSPSVASLGSSRDRHEPRRRAHPRRPGPRRAASSAEAARHDAEDAERRKFSACMRSHGVPNFPDPNSQGAIRSGRARGSTRARRVPGRRSRVPEAAAERRPAEPAAGGEDAEGGACVLGLHALARRAGLPRPGLLRRRRQALAQGRPGQRPQPELGHVPGRAEGVSGLAARKGEREVTALRSQLARRRVLVGAAVVVVAVAVAVIAIVGPFGGGAAPSSSGLDNGAATSTTRVTRRDLSSQTQVGATLGYADPSTISLPGGTAPASVQQAQQSAASAQSALAGAQATLATDQTSLEQARATLAGDRRKLSVDCGGDNAAQAGGGRAGGAAGSAGACATDAQDVAAGDQALTGDTAKVAGDERAVSSATTALSGASEALATAQTLGVAVRADARSTRCCPPPVKWSARGDALYAISGQPVVLLFGRTAAWRAFAAGHDAGPRRRRAECEPPCARLRRDVRRHVHVRDRGRGRGTSRQPAACRPRGSCCSARSSSSRARSGWRP